MTITYRTAGAWGPGKGANLTAAEVDGNFHGLATRLVAVETNPAQPAQIEAMRMSGNPPSPSNRTTWFLEGMLHHHGGALQMAHNALQNSSNATIRRLAREIIVAQRREILELRRMLRHDGLNKPAYYQYDPLFAL